MAKIDIAYKELLDTILKSGFMYEDAKRVGVNRLQVSKYDFVHDMEDGFPAITTKKLAWKSIVTELIWFLNGDTNIKYLVDNGCNIWNKDAYSYFLKQTGYPDCEKSRLNFNKGIHIANHRAGDLGKIYGAQWRSFNGVDQFHNLINEMITQPMSTEHIVTAWNPGDKENMALPPCHFGFQIMCRPIESGYEFDLIWDQRSVDTFLGLPFNIASYALLMEIIGKLTNMKPKMLYGSLRNVHLYDNSIVPAKEQLSRDVNKYSSGKLKMSDKFYNSIKSKNLNSIVKRLRIDDFILEDYESYDTIKVKMLERTIT